MNHEIRQIHEKRLSGLLFSFAYFEYFVVEPVFVLFVRYVVKSAPNSI